ncbi:CLUMA_CG013246, isoform B [Clunio marinus]|uniref:CLUMA_CG013246, isoform B n=1 Tax=Clunio marinus TaxID=568069 RepID=A0A1J1II69_9DIPT|nr:CLUMA_CG013246, isoform B [Clunio marinus]
MSIKVGEDKIPYIDLGDGYIIRLEYEDLSDEKYIEKAKTELRESPENIEKGLHELRRLIEAEKDFTFPKEADVFLMTFLRPCKFYASSAFEKMQKYFKFKLKHKKVCENINVKSVSNVFTEDLIKYLPLRDINGRRILYLNCGKKWKPSRVTPNDIFRAVQLSLHAAMAEPMTQVNGVTVILDTDGLSISQICHFTPSYAAMVLDWLQNCIAVRLKAIYIVNNSYIFNMLYAVFKPFIGSKIHFLNKDWETLTSKVGEHALRKEFGGDLLVDDVDGKLLVEFLNLFHEQFELVAHAGYGVCDEETKKLIDKGVEEALTYISKA